VLSQRLLDSPYIAGDEFTAADVYVGSHVLWGLQFGTMDIRDGFKEYAARVSNREAFKAAKKIDDQLIAERQ
jgi:glutathione S-transferase